MKKNFLIVIFVITTVLLMASCGQKDTIVGVWERVDDDNKEYVIELYEDGTAITPSGNGKYETTESSITLINIPLLGSVQKFDYELDGDTLSLTQDDDTTYFERVKE